MQVVQPCILHGQNGHAILDLIQSAGHLNNFELEPLGVLSQGQEPGILDFCEGLLKNYQQGLVVGRYEQIWAA